MERSELAAISDHAWGFCATVLTSNRLKSIEDWESINNLAKNAMLSVQPCAWDEGHEELRSIGVWSGVGHREVSSSGMSDSEVLVSELHAIDRLSSGTVSSGEISSLSHELGDNSVERATLVAKWLSTLSNTLLSSAESSEILGGLWSLVSVELHGDSTGWLVTDGDIEENMWVSHFEVLKNYL